MPTAATILHMGIDGDVLRRQRKRCGFRNQETAARAVGVSLRLYGPWETSGVPDEYVTQVRKAFWPNGDEADADAPESLWDLSNLGLVAHLQQVVAVLVARLDESSRDYEDSTESATTAGGESTVTPNVGGVIDGSLGRPPHRSDDRHRGTPDEG